MLQYQEYDCAAAFASMLTLVSGEVVQVASATPKEESPKW